MTSPSLLKLIKRLENLVKILWSMDIPSFCIFFSFFDSAYFLKYTLFGGYLISEEINDERKTHNKFDLLQLLCLVL